MIYGNGSSLRRRSAMGGMGLADQLDNLGRPQPHPGSVTDRRTPPRLTPRNIGARRANQAFRWQQEIRGDYLKPELERLSRQANTNRFDDSERAHYLAQDMDALDQQQRNAEGDLTRNLAARGLSDSSAMASGLGSILMGGAQARAGLVSNLHQAEQDRQLGAQADLRDFAGGMYGNEAGTAGSLSNQIRAMDLEEERMRMAKKAQGGGFLGDLLGGIGGIAGTAFGGGWQPFRKTPKRQY